jgi:hypothetical protein
MRKLAREAVIFMLLGPFVTALIVFVYLNSQNEREIKAETVSHVYAIDAALEPDGFTPDNSVLVPLTNGVKLYVQDCSQVHPWVVSSTPEQSAVKPTALPRGLVPTPPGAKDVPIPPGATNGTDCVYFTDSFRDEAAKYGGHMASVPLGNENQVAIEKEYWSAYAKSKHQHHVQNAIASLLLSLWGFPAGILLWAFYRLVRFAVKG